MSAAWKHAERRVAVALGGRRAGPLGAAVSDIVGVPWSVEVKYCKSTTVRAGWITQAKTQGRAEGLDWLLVVFGHNDRAPTVTMDFATFEEIARRAGSLPAERVPPTGVPARGRGAHQAGTTTPHERGKPMHETQTEPEPQPEPDEPQPEPDEPDDDEAEQ